MLTIDADAHVIECEKTWDYLEGADKRYRPVPIAVDMPTGKKSNFWIIGGRLIGGRDNIGQDTSKESREMANIDSRLTHGRDRHRRAGTVSNFVLAAGDGQSAHRAGALPFVQPLDGGHLVQG